MYLTLLNHRSFNNTFDNVTCYESFGLSILITDFVEIGRIFLQVMNVIPIQDWRFTPKFHERYRTEFVPPFSLTKSVIRNIFGKSSIYSIP